MRHASVLFAAALLALATPALAAPFAAAPHPPSEQPPPPPPAITPAVTREQSLLALLTPPVREWVGREGLKLPQLGPPLDAARSAVMRRYPDVFGSDLEAMAFLVVMAAAHDADDDLRRKVIQIDSENRASEALLQAHGSKDDRHAKPRRSGYAPEDQARLQPFIDRKEALERAALAMLPTLAAPNAATLGHLQ